MPFAATWMEVGTLILRNKSERDRQMPYDITHIWYLIYSTNKAFNRKRKSSTWRIDLWLPGGEREGVGGIGSLGSMDAKSCSWSEFIMRSCSVALKTMSRCLQHSTTIGEKIMYTYMCNWVPMLYSGKKSVLGEVTITNKLKN